ncbi:MAG TPA: hydrogenase formation protein HypD [Syntrophomonas sp.]|nr:hydrogenase formation protein HypD [Syntrophomonas sp.]
MDNDVKEYKQHLLRAIQLFSGSVSIMEVCGTHTMAIAKSGIRGLLPPNIKLLSGPGCPVCVTSQGDIDAVIVMVQHKDIILITFGDMMRVPGTHSSLQEERSRGADIRIAYSPLDALRVARDNPDKEVVFLGIGFETTTPTIAITIEQARREGLNNFSVFSLHKVVPPALELIFSDSEIKVDGLLCPGHVSAVIGVKTFGSLARKYHKPCVVTGFETLDILEGIYMLLQQLKKEEARVENQYSRVVKPEGNPIACQSMERVFQPVPARWRGLGMIPASGLQLREEFSDMDARKRFDIPEIEEIPIKGCACGEVLAGKITPLECVLFGQACTPLNPVGPCMVSHEGSCAAYYRYIPTKGRS